jgi:arylsulfatase A-like enzyme
MKRLLAVLTSSLIFIGAQPLAVARTPQPNIVFFLVDDLGYMDIGAYNRHNFYETPNCDRIAAAGCRFTNGYAANPVCSPTRYSILTGRYPSRPDATNFFAGRRGGTFAPAPLHDRMDLEEVTLAESLQEAGYATCFAGKWHLGPTEEFWPEKQGFDVNIGGNNRGMPRSYFSPYSNPRLDDGPKGEHLPDRLATESIKFIKAQQKHPFFLYLSFYSVHTPLQGKRALVDKYIAKAAKLPSVKEEPEFGIEEQVSATARARKVRIRQRHATYAAMMESMDSSVGRVLDALDQLKLTDHTIVVFMSDNGGLSTSEGSPTSNLPLRGGKGWVYEGGIREPYMIVAPEITKPGSVCHEPVISTDFYPTLLALTRTPPKPSQTLDGRSLVPLLKDPHSSLDRPSLYWHYPHYSNQGGFPGGAIRTGDFKLVERYEDGRVHLFNLAHDLGEKIDLADQHPDRVTAMRQDLHAWYKKVDAKFLQKKEASQTPWRP